MEKKYCIIIAGPTAAGKTNLAIAVARHFQTSIISADSRQCYKELNIGVAKPSPRLLREIRHYFISSHSVTQELNAAMFEEYALQAVSEIFLTNRIAVLVGGTGLYLKAFCDGMDEIPGIPSQIRTEIREEFENKGMEWLQNEVCTSDPEYYAKGEVLNPRRLMRALEVKRATGQSILAFQQGGKRSRDFEWIKIGLELPKEQLHQNIDFRTEQMIAQGLVDEVRSLSPFRTLNALQTVGYQEIFEYLDGKLSLDQAIAFIKKNTRQYAKRQMTWFRRDPEISWFHPGHEEEIVNFIVSRMQV